MPITDVTARNAKPTAKVQRLFDGGGLYLEVTPAGGKWWRIKYRVPGKDQVTGQAKLIEKRMSLGTYPEVSLKEAREKRDAARKLLADGQDPSQARQAEKAAKQAELLKTFEGAAGLWMEHRTSQWDTETLRKVRASLVTHAFPTIGAKPLTAVKPADVRELVKKVDAEGARETAGRLFQRVRAIYRYAIEHELTDADPTASLKPSEFMTKQEVKHRAALAEKDMPGFFLALSDYRGEAATRPALLLLILTAVRPGEVRCAKWEEIDQDRALWRIPAERMKMKTEHTVPLSRQALELLKELRTLTGGGALLFPSPFYPGKPISDGTLNSALARLGYKGTATAHGFRTLFSTCANEAGWPADVIEKQLAHEERDGVRAAYNRASWLPQRQELMQWWGDHLDAIAKGAKVIPFKAA
jgi:integrase